MEPITTKFVEAGTRGLGPGIGLAYPPNLDEMVLPAGVTEKIHLRVYNTGTLPFIARLTASYPPIYPDTDLTPCITFVPNDFLLEPPAPDAPFPTSVSVDMFLSIPRDWAQGSVHEGAIHAAAYIDGVIPMVTAMVKVTVLGEVPPPGKGTLYVRAFRVEDTVRAEELQIPVKIVGVGTYTTPFTIDLDPGTYTLNAWYLGDTQTKTAEAISGGVTYVDFEFLVVAPPPVVPPVPVLWYQRTIAGLPVWLLGVGAVAVAALAYTKRKR